jgi:hypothetical protein
MAEAAGDVVRLPTPRGDAEARRMAQAEAGRSRWCIIHPWGTETFFGTEEQVLAHLRKRTAEQQVAETGRPLPGTEGVGWRT